MSSFYGGFTIAGGGGSIDPSVKIDYSQIANAPIKDMYGSSPINFVLVSGLDYGHYTLSGYFKQDSNSNVQELENKIEIFIERDKETGNKTLMFFSVENGIYYINTLIYNNNGIIIERKKTSLNDETETKASWGSF